MPNGYGDDGNDFLDGGDDTDVLQGGAGSDTYYADGNDDNDTVTDAGGSNDAIRFGNGYRANNLIITTVSTYDLKVRYTGSTGDHFTIIGQRDTGDTKQIERVIFDDGANMSLLHYTSWNLQNTSANSVTGTGSDDYIWGNAGNDTLDGAGGNDELNGGSDDDTLKGGTGNDALYGGNGVDTADYSAAAGAVTASLASGTASNDGDSGADTFDSIENLTGSANGDTLTGDNNANTLIGGAGNDVLYGQGGQDDLWGGDDADTFVFESATAFNDIDTIKDFDPGEDDAIDIADVLDLAGYEHGVDALTDWVQILTNGSDSELYVDATGTATFNAGSMIALIEGVAGLTDEAALVTNGNLIVV